MADNNNPRYRSNDSFDRGAAPAAPASDPLAELARLIGRNDPFAELGRDHHPSPPQESGFRYTSPPTRDDVGDAVPGYGSDPAPYRETEPLHGGDPALHYNDAPPRYSMNYAPQHGDDRLSQDDWYGGAAPAHPYSPADPFALPPQPHAPMLSEQGYDEQGGAMPAHGAGLDSYQPVQSDAEPAGYTSAPDQPSYAAPPLYPEEPEVGAMPAPHDDEFYDDAPQGNRRRGLLTVAAVLALAVIGTAGAFGYRNFFGADPSSPPPVIRASGGPSKVAPPPSAADQSPSKFTYDRFGDRGKDEQVVVREEKPVDTGNLARSGVPRTVLPGGLVANSLSAKPLSAGAPSAANPPSVLGEPRRVRTVPIRPDHPEIAAAPQTVAPAPMSVPMPAPTPAAPPRRTEMASAALPKPAQTAAPPPVRTAPPVAARAAPSRSASRAASRSARPPAPVVHAPLSLSPAGNNALPPPGPRASAPPPRAPSAPMRLTSAPTRSVPAPRVTSSGRYLVQVSSQRSEADARTSFRNIQAKYSNVLGGRPHVIRRADLGRRGIYYRAMVGPFATRQQALQLCSSLKAAGGACIVQSH